MMRPLYILTASSVVLVMIMCSSREHAGPEGGHFQSTVPISFDDYRLYYQQVQFTKALVKQYFQKTVLNRYTGRLFRTLAREFGNLSGDDHVHAVEKYLNGSLDAKRAGDMVSLYKRYTSCENKLMRESQGWINASMFSPGNENKIEYIYRIHEFRRRELGTATADVIYGAGVTIMEYTIKKNEIAFSKDLYGGEKEKRIDALKREVWGDDAGRIDSALKPYRRYQEKLILYRRDLTGMPEAERSRMIVMFRRQFFSPQVVNRLGIVDNALNNEINLENDYRRRKEIIEKNSGLTREQKEKEIRALQDTVFGDDAEAFRRREKIRLQFEKMAGRQGNT